MTTIHVQQIGGKALIAQHEFERLIALARQQEPIKVLVEDDDVPTYGLMRLVEQGGSFDFWTEAGEDVYSLVDGDPV